MSMSDFLKKLEHYGKLAFPEATMIDAKLRCLSSSLQANCRSKILAYEIHNFIQEKTTDSTQPDFSEISLKAIELDQILGDKEDYSDGELDEKSPSASIFNVKNKRMFPKKETRKCYNCGIAGHLKATCCKNRNNSQNNKSGKTNNFQKKNSYYRRNDQNKSPNNPPQNSGKVHMLDTTDLQSLDLNSYSRIKSFCCRPRRRNYDWSR